MASGADYGTLLHRSSKKPKTGASSAEQDIVLISKYGGFPEDEDQIEERAAAMARAIRTPRRQLKV